MATKKHEETQRRKYMKDRQALILCVFSCLFVAIESSAAPPTIAYLYPAGAQRGTTVEVAASGVSDKGVKFWTSGKGVTAEPGKGKGKMSVGVAKDAAPGVYWVRAYNAEGASPLKPFIVGTLPEVAEKETNDEFQKPQVLEGSSIVVNGQLAKSGDVDCFAIDLKKGQTLVASLEANEILRSPMDAILQVADSSGFVVAQNHDFRGLDPQLAYTADRDGRYIARVFAFPSQPNSTIRFSSGDNYVYRLMLTTGGFADHPWPLAAGPGVESVAVRGWNVPDSLNLRLPKLEPGETHVALFDPSIANPVRVRVETHMSIVLDPKAPEKKPLAPPFSASGILARDGDEALVLITGKKGQALSIQVESRTLGLAVNPVVRVLDAEKKQLARTEPGKLNSDVTLSFNPPADGTYTVAVSDLYREGGPRHAFLLRVLTPEPDYELTVAADRFAVPPGKSLDIPVKVARRGGLKQPIEIVAEGLPEGVKMAVKPPEKKADPNTITVTLSADKAGPAGAFRLVGRVKGEPDLLRTATAPLADFGTTTADLWVSVSDTAVSQPPKKKKR
jgi:hypothetical protein